MSNPVHDKFGSPIGGSRWFNSSPQIVGTPVSQVREVWRCPIEGCAGEMVFNGMTWPTGTPGYHHTCSVCRFTAALRGEKYPRITYVEVKP